MSCSNPTKIGQHPIHPITALVPDMEPDQFRRFCVSLKKYGLQSPILRHSARLVVCGRQRLRGCLEVGIAPRLAEWVPKGKTVPEIEQEIRILVLTSDIDRRHIADKSVRAYTTAQLIGEFGKPGRPGGRSENGENSPLSLRSAAKQAGIDRETLRDAIEVKQKGAPALKQAVAAGEFRASDAANVMHLSKAEQAKVLQDARSGRGQHAYGRRHGPHARPDKIDGASDKTDWYEGTFRIREMAETPDLFLKSILKALAEFDATALDVVKVSDMEKKGKPRREFVGFCRRGDCQVGVYKTDRHTRHEDGSVECGECRPGGR